MLIKPMTYALEESSKEAASSVHLHAQTSQVSCVCKCPPFPTGEPAIREFQ